jgi:phosphate transport system substrate-binding protein
MKALRSVLLLGLVLSSVACKSKYDASAEKGSSAPGTKAADNQTVALNGAGATFPYPLYSKWMAEYNKQNPNIRINYQSIGSGGGIRQIIAGTVDFGATDAPMSEDEAKKAPGKLLHIPTTIGAVAITYNLPEVTAKLQLTGQVIVDVYLGTIKKWNDPKIAAANPGMKLPAKDIAVVYRTDGSGTTSVFTEYLASVAPSWKEKVGVAKSVKWPAGLGAKGNEGVTGQVKTTPGAIGYVELAYALQNKMPVAAVQNKAGKFTTPEISAITAAAEGVELSENMTASIVNTEGEAAYPISAYTYILVYEEAKKSESAQQLAEFLWWAAHDGQKFCEALHYAPLPAKTVSKVEERLKTLRSGDKKLL